MIIKIIKGDLLDAKEFYICQQCNCVTVKSQGLSKYISEKYSWADPYKIRLEHDEPGTIVELKHPSQQDNSWIAAQQRGYSEDRICNSYRHARHAPNPVRKRDGVTGAGPG